MIGTSDQSCWLAEACNILLLLLVTVYISLKLANKVVAAAQLL